MKNPFRGFSAFILQPSSFILSVTLLGGILRFTFLSRPAIWGDEAATFRRVCSSFHDLLNELSISAFAPLHYMLYWAIGQLTPLTPFMMRLVPAICGTLMIPAMYALAAQIVARRTAMLVALFTACSSYMLTYSRDAKMYAEFWLFVTLSMACLLWWLRTDKRFAWYLWVICGLVMLGLQPVGGMVLAVQFLVLLSHRRVHWKPVVMFEVGVALIVAPLLVYYAGFSRYPREVNASGWEGLEWIASHNAGLSGPDLVRSTATQFLYKWEWPRAWEQRQVNPRLLKLFKAAAVVMFGLIAAGIFPWRRLFGMDDEPDPPPQAWWRSFLWIAAWMLLPAYGIYCASVPNATAPWQWLLAVRDLGATKPLLAIVAAIPVAASIYLGLPTWRRRLCVPAIFLAVAAALFGVCCAIYSIVPTQPHSLWVTRYLGLTWPAFAIAVCVLITRLPTRPLRFGVIGLVVAVNLVQFAARVFAGTEPPTEQMVRDVLVAQPADSTTRNFYHVRSPGMFGPGMGFLDSLPAAYYLAVFTNTRITPNELEFGGMQRRFRTGQIFLPPQFYVPTDLSRNPQITRLVYWDGIEPGKPPPPEWLAQKLPQWKCVDETLYRVREHWMWLDLLTVRRRVFLRQPTTAPTSQP